MESSSRHCSLTFEEVKTALHDSANIDIANDLLILLNDDQKKELLDTCFQTLCTDVIDKIVLSLPMASRLNAIEDLREKVDEDIFDAFDCIIRSTDRKSLEPGEVFTAKVMEAVLRGYTLWRKSDRTELYIPNNPVVTDWIDFNKILLKIEEFSENHLGRVILAPVLFSKYGYQWQLLVLEPETSSLYFFNFAPSCTFHWRKWNPCRKCYYIYKKIDEPDQSGLYVIQLAEYLMDHPDTLSVHRDSSHLNLKLSNRDIIRFLRIDGLYFCQQNNCFESFDTKADWESHELECLLAAGQMDKPNWSSKDYLDEETQLYNQARFREAEVCEGLASQMSLLAHGEETNQEDIAKCYVNVGETLSLRKYTEAEECARTALNMLLYRFGKTTTNTDIAKSYQGLGVTLLTPPRYTEEYLGKSLNRLWNIYGNATSNTDITLSYKSLGATLHDHGRYLEAAEYKKKALNMLLSIYGNTTNNTVIAESYKSLGVTLHDLGRYWEAKDCKRKALNMLLSIYGNTTNNTDIAESYKSLGVTLHDLGRYSEAADCKRKALNMLLSIYGNTTNNTNIAEGYQSLGKTHYNLSKYTQAEECGRKAVDIKSTACSHDETARILRSLALTLRASGKISEAQECEKEASCMKTVESKGEDGNDFSEGDEIFSTDNITISLGSCVENLKSLYKSQEVYPMSKVTRGRCLIINNKTFLECNKLPDDTKGSEVDVKNLAHLFSTLRFNAIVKEDIEGNRLEEVIESEVSLHDHLAYGMFVLVIMTHGGNVMRHDVLQEVYNCKSLKGKPKLVIIQACAGDRRTRHEFDTTTSLSSLSLDTSAPPEDVVLLMSGFDEFLPVRVCEFGSPFIRTLTEAIYKHAHNWDIEKIFKQVTRKLRVARYPLATFTSSLRKMLYFFPNYDGE